MVGMKQGRRGLRGAGRDRHATIRKASAGGAHRRRRACASQAGCAARLTAAPAPLDVAPALRSPAERACRRAGRGGASPAAATPWRCCIWPRPGPTRAGRRLVALTVDHGLQPASADWTRFAAERAGGSASRIRTLAWTGDKPAAGLPAAARAARHALLAEAARRGRRRGHR